MKCASCYRLIHFKCAESGQLDENVLKMLKLKAVLYYICVKCAPNRIKGRIRIEDKEGNTISAEVKEMQVRLTSNEQYTLRQTKEIGRLLDENAQLNSQLTKNSENDPTEKENERDVVIQSLRAQLDVFSAENSTLSDQIKLMQDEINKIKSKSSSSMVKSPSLMDISEQELLNKDTIIASKNIQIDTLKEQVEKLSTQVTSLLNTYSSTSTLPNTVMLPNVESTSLPHPKRFRENEENGQDALNVRIEPQNARNEPLNMEIDTDSLREAEIESISDELPQLNFNNNTDLNNMPEGASAFLKSIELIMQKMLTPFRRELGNIHDRIDMIQYPDQSPKELRIPPKHQDKQQTSNQFQLNQRSQSNQRFQRPKQQAQNNLNDDQNFPSLS